MVYIGVGGLVGMDILADVLDIGLLIRIVTRKVG